MALPHRQARRPDRPGVGGDPDKEVAGTGLSTIVTLARRQVLRTGQAGRLMKKVFDRCGGGQDMPKQEKTMTKYALYVPLEAKPGKEKEVVDFLRSAVPLVDAEPGTISWFAIQEGPAKFAIFDTFDDEAGRNAHLNGKVAAALMEKAKSGDLFAKTPEIHKMGILADKLPQR
jgi:quinol monooxygenase YgiN